MSKRESGTKRPFAVTDESGNEHTLYLITPVEIYGSSSGGGRSGMTARIETEEGLMVNREGKGIYRVPIDDLCEVFFVVKSDDPNAP